ncbi:HTH domain-containing protein [Acidobacteria bacterium AH-259-G07]|nr:HTH domain-containing protein [Acidobacteria bacterium AH-259-G07]
MPRNRKSTYLRVLELLKQTGGGVSVKELCGKLDLSSMAVRRQLMLLEGDDLVLTLEEKKKSGRPVQQYYLTEKGHESFERDYAGLAMELLVGIRSLDGRTKVNELFEWRSKEHVERCRGRVLGKTLEARVHQVTQVLTQDGYMATWEKLGPKRYLIKEMNCAVARVARKFPHACVYEQEFLSELLQAKVTRKHHILQKDHFCSYLVEG